MASCWAIPCRKPSLHFFLSQMSSEGHEIRAIGKEGITRVFFAAKSKEIVILHGFMKKTDKTPKRELETARRRLKEVWDENA